MEKMCSLKNINMQESVQILIEKNPKFSYNYYLQSSCVYEIRAKEKAKSLSLNMKKRRFVYSAPRQNLYLFFTFYIIYPKHTQNTL